MLVQEAVGLVMEGYDVDEIVDGLCEGRGRARRAQGGRLSRKAGKQQVSPLSSKRRGHDRDSFRAVIRGRSRSGMPGLRTHSTEQLQRTLLRGGLSTRGKDTPRYNQLTKRLVKAALNNKVRSFETGGSSFSPAENQWEPDVNFFSRQELGRAGLSALRGVLARQRRGLSPQYGDVADFWARSTGMAGKPRLKKK